MRRADRLERLEASLAQPRRAPRVQQGELAEIMALWHELKTRPVERCHRAPWPALETMTDAEAVDECRRMMAGPPCR
jgi:hypothetical protein